MSSDGLLCFAVLVFSLAISCINGTASCERTTFELEAENGFVASDNLLTKCRGEPPLTPCVQYRSAASDGFAALLSRKGQSVWFVIKLFTACSFRVLNLFYSNDGERDVISIDLNNYTIGNFTTLQRSNNGKYWNKFVESGEISHTYFLDPNEVSEYRLTIWVSSTDEYGVELDRILIKFTCDGECPVILPSHPQGGNNDDSSHATAIGIGTAVGIGSLFVAIISLLIAIYRCMRENS